MKDWYRAGVLNHPHKEAWFVSRHLQTDFIIDFWYQVRPAAKSGFESRAYLPLTGMEYHGERWEVYPLVIEAMCDWIFDEYLLTYPDDAIITTDAWQERDTTVRANLGPSNLSARSAERTLAAWDKYGG